VPVGDANILINENTLPGGSTQTEGTNPTTVTVPDAGIATDVDGFEPVATLTDITGVVYEDSNSNNAQDAGEPGIAGVTVTVADSLGNTQTLSTDVDGHYAANVPEGDVVITVNETTLPGGYTQTEGTNPTTITAVLGSTVSDVDGYTATTAIGNIHGTVYEDSNGDGTQDPGEPALSGVTVEITDSIGNTQTVMTDENGTYMVTVPAGDVNITIDKSTLPTGSTQTEGTNPTTVTVPVNGTATDTDGFEPSATPSFVNGVVYEDSNGNGLQDAGEPGIANVAVTITDSTSSIQTLYTNSNGEYNTAVAAGDVLVDIEQSDIDPTFTQTEGTDPTIVNVPNGGIGSDVDGFAPPSVDILISDASVIEGGNLTFTVSLSVTSTVDINITVQTSDVNGTATEGVDYTATTVTVMIPAGSISTTVSVPSIEDTIDEADETFTLSTVSTVGGFVRDISDTGTGTIIDDDSIHVFDPPSATKVANAAGWPEIEWRMVWINDGNALAMNVHIEDPLVSDVNFTAGSLTCEPRGTSVTDANATGCYYDAATRTVIWNGNIAADLNNSTEATAENEVVITFRTSVTTGIHAVENQGLAYWDQNGDSYVDYNETVATDDPAVGGNDDPTRVIDPLLFIPNAVDDGVIEINHYEGTVIDVLVNDSFGNDNNFSAATGLNAIEIITQPTHGTVSLDDGGTPNDPTDDIFIYSPIANVSEGTDVFTYRICDTDGDCDDANVTLYINCASTQTSDGGDALGVSGVLLMMLLFAGGGLIFLKREEKFLSKGRN